jgi:hypothetical protein
MNTELIKTVIASISAIVVALIPFYVELRKQKKRINNNENKTNKNEEKIDKNEEKIDKLLVLYRPGAIAYKLLLAIKNRSDVPYKDEDINQKRCLNHLLDDGYLQPTTEGEYIEFGSKYNGRKLSEIVCTTPLADTLINYRNNNESTK